MKSLACLRLLLSNDHGRHDGTIKPNRANRFHPHAPAKVPHTLSKLILASTFLLFCQVTAQAQEPGGAATATGGGARLSRQQPGGGGGGVAQAGVYSDRLQSVVARGPGGRTPAKALVVLSSSSDAKVQGNLQEDLAVMSHILEKAMDDSLGSDQRQPRAMGVDLFFWADAGSLRQAYLEGYGALFLLKINSPLLPSPAKDEAQKDEPKGSSAWEEAREEVFGEPGPIGMISGAPEEPYNEAKVNRLKGSILEALKNATNIRDLKADEGVTVCVLGGTKMQSGRVKAFGRAGGKPGEMAWLASPAEGTPQRGTILSLRVKKSAIDAFAKGQMDLGEFQKKALITIYEVDSNSGPGFGGYGIGGGGGYGGGYGTGLR